MGAKVYTWAVMVIEDGYAEVHTEDLEQEEAEQLAQELNETFPDNQYYAQTIERKEEAVERHYNENAVDGWEDLYPTRD